MIERKVEDSFAGGGASVRARSFPRSGQVPETK